MAAVVILLSFFGLAIGLFGAIRVFLSGKAVLAKARRDLALECQLTAEWNAANDVPYGTPTPEEWNAAQNRNNAAYDAKFKAAGLTTPNTGNADKDPLGNGAVVKVLGLVVEQNIGNLMLVGLGAVLGFASDVVSALAS